MIITALKKIYLDKRLILLSLIVFIASFGLTIFLMTRTASWEALWAMNNPMFNIFQILLNLIVTILFGVVLAMLVYIYGNKKKTENQTALQAFAAIFFSAVTTGCYVCGTVLLPTLGITASLAALPFGGLEIKLMSIILLIYSIFEFSKNINGICAVYNKKFIRFEKGRLLINPTKQIFMKYKYLFVTILFLVMVFTLPILGDILKIDFTNHSAQANEYSCNTS
ncbi:MAG TPA: hypothetical protein VGA67_03570, partial [Candidatus Dojkabacteria bacterium]